MPSPLPPPSGVPTASAPSPRRRRPWLLALLALALFVTTFGLVVLIRDRADAGRADGSSQATDAEPPPTRSGPPPTGDGPPPGSATPSPGDRPGDTAPPNSGEQGSGGD